MTTNLRHAMGSLFSASALALGLTILGSIPASAQQIAPEEQIMILNVGGAIGRMLDTSWPNAPVFMFVPNVSQRRLLWKFSRDSRVPSAFKIASTTDPTEVLSLLPNQYQWYSLMTDRGFLK